MVKHPFEGVQIKKYLSNIDQNFDLENITDSLVIAANDIRQVIPPAFYDDLIASIDTNPVNPDAIPNNSGIKADIFNVADLNSDGELVITTDFDITDFDISITDNQGNKIDPFIAQQTGDREITLHLDIYAPLPGVWKYMLTFIGNITGIVSSDKFTEAVELLRYAMAPLTFYRAFIWLQLRVSNNSITTYKSADEVTAFKYQIDDAKENLLLRYAAFMKELIDHLNANADIFTNWKDSNQQKALADLLIKDYRDFDNYILTDGDAAFFYRARVIMKEAQDDDIIPQVGDLSKITDPKLISKLKKALAYLTIARAMYDWDDFYLPAPIRRLIPQKTSGSGSTMGKTASHDSDKERLSFKYRNTALTILKAIDVQQKADKAENDYPDDPINIKSPHIDKDDKHYYMT